jgi:5S rRNA maturation endonuclease (ribonuclease M5)
VNWAATLETLEQVLDELRQAAASSAILVEGRRDVDALERLGVGGEHLLIHTGKSLDSRTDELVACAQTAGWPSILLLTDWDRTGNALAKRLEMGLSARVSVDVSWRRRLGRVTQATCIEHIPAELASLRRRVHPPKI